MTPFGGHNPENGAHETRPTRFEVLFACALIAAAVWLCIAGDRHDREQLQALHYFPCRLVACPLNRECEWTDEQGKRVYTDSIRCGGIAVKVVR